MDVYYVPLLYFTSLTTEKTQIQGNLSPKHHNNIRTDAHQTIYMVFLQKPDINHSLGLVAIVTDIQHMSIELVIYIDTMH